MRRFVLALLASFLIGTAAEAATCTCSSTCTSSASTNWSCAAIPGAADDVIVASGGTATIDNSPTWNTAEVQANGTLKCTDDSTARTVTIDNVKNGPNAGGSAAWLWVRAGGTLDCDGATGVEGNDVTFNWTGTIGASSAASFFAGDGSSSNENPTADAIVKLRGLRRGPGVGNVENVGAGLTDDFVWCADLVGPTSYAVGDTVVFTSGRLDEFWCRIDALASAGTAECSVAACNGGACDIELDCNDASDPFRSFTSAAAGTGGPVRAATPTDCNGDGTADNDCAYPMSGDAVTVFKPARINGSATPITGGPSLFFAGVQANIRYLELYRTGGLPTLQGCTNAGGTCGGWASLAFFTTTSIAPEGDIAYVNLFEQASDIAMELNQTDRTGDSRANYPIVARHFYIHDPSATVEACTCGVGGEQRMGEGLVLTTDAADGSQSNITLDGFHFARMYGAPFSVTAPSTISQPNHLTFTDMLVHDVPKTATYGGDATCIFAMQGGKDALVRGLAIWDIGNNNDDPELVCVEPLATAPTPDDPTKIRFQNIYAVNWDNNAVAPVDTAGQAVNLGSSNVALETAQNVVSNSYFSNLGWGVGNAGTWRFNFLLNNWIENDGAAPCTTGGRRGTLRFPAEATGNVFWRTLTTSCSPASIMNDVVNVGGGGAAKAYHPGGARKYTSNIFGDMLAESAGLNIQGIWIHNTSIAETGSTDIYNNLADLRGVNANGEYGLFLADTNASSTGTINFFYNIAMSALTSGVRYTGTMPATHGYNRFYRVLSTYGGGILSLGTGEVDSDVMDFLAASDQYYQPLCDMRRGGPYGGPIGPLVFGIRDFGGFHPAVVAAMHPLVWQFRYNWLMCSGANQDAIPR